MPNTLSMVFAAAIGFGCVACLPETAELPQTSFIIEAVTVRGDVYIAGSGDDCRTAWQRAELPRDYVQIICRAAD